MTRRERILDELRVQPGTSAAIAERDPGWTGGPDYEGLTHDALQDEAKAVLARDVERLSSAQELLWASDTRALLVVFQAMDAAGKDSAIEHVHVRRQPAGCPGLLLQDALGRGARSRLPLADREGRARARPDRHLQPLALRRGRRAARASRVARQAAPAGVTRRPGVLGRALRGHQRLRASPRPQRDEDRQVLPPRLEGRAEEALPRAARRAAQGMEVQRGRRRRAGAAGTTTWRRTRARSPPPRRPGRRGT